MCCSFICNSFLKLFVCFISLLFIRLGKKNLNYKISYSKIF